jgi:hypothetical protein
LRSRRFLCSSTRATSGFQKVAEPVADRELVTLALLLVVVILAALEAKVVFLLLGLERLLVTVPGVLAAPGLLTAPGLVVSAGLVASADRVPTLDLLASLLGLLAVIVVVGRCRALPARARLSRPRAT